MEARVDICSFKVEVPITDNLRYYTLNMEKYEVVQFFPCRKIEIRRTPIFFDNFIP